jgi:ribosomal protein S18 acetylase RimI-like enzyme
MGPNGEVGRGPETGGSVVVRAGRAQDSAAVGALHAERISEGFLSHLGPRFLARLYQRITLVPDSFLIVAECHGDPVGFIAGSGDVSALYRSFLVRDGIPAAVGSAGQLILGWRRVMETLRHGSADGAGTGRGAELLAIAVAQDQSGRGTGQMLVEAFLTEVLRRGHTAAHVVVGADNSPAISLYRRAGFAEGGRFELHPGTESLLMQWDRTPDRGSA